MSREIPNPIIPDDPMRHATARMYGEFHEPAATITIASPALRDVIAERRRQVEGEGWTAEHDDAHSAGEMTFAALAYLMAVVNPNGARKWWPSWSWSFDWFKPGPPRSSSPRSSGWTEPQPKTHHPKRRRCDG